MQRVGSPEDEAPAMTCKETTDCSRWACRRHAGSPTRNKAPNKGKLKHKLVPAGGAIVRNADLTVHG